MIDYKEQIKSPKWQKKRLEILDRDNFECVVCGASDKPLHVHHKKYIAGRDYWDYPDELLVTLCEDCHKKFHGKEESEKKPNPSRPDSIRPIKSQSLKKKISYRRLFDNEKGLSYLHHKMLIPFYNALLCNVELSPTERIVYSFLAYKSLSYMDNAFTGSNFNVEFLKEEINGPTYITCWQAKQSELAESLWISEKSVWSTIHRLRKLSILVDDCIKVDENLVFDKGYFPLRLETGLKGLLLIFYSYLKDKAELNGGWVSMGKEKMAQLISTSICGVTKLLNRLYRRKLAKRIGNKILIF